jgi:hypothetical protein
LEKSLELPEMARKLIGKFFNHFCPATHKKNIKKLGVKQFWESKFFGGQRFCGIKNIVGQHFVWSKKQKHFTPLQDMCAEKFCMVSMG